MTTLSEFFTRFITRSFYIVFTALTLLLVLSDVEPFRFLGFLFALFLADRFIHLGQAEKTLAELGGGKINLAEGITPVSYNLLSHALHKTLVTGDDFCLLLLRNLVLRNDAKEALRRLDVSYKDFLIKLEKYLEDVPRKKHSRGELLKTIENLTRGAYENALKNSEKFIEPRNFLVALASLNYPPLIKLLDLFELRAVDLQEAVVYGRFRKFFAGLSRIPSVLGGFAHQAKFLRHRVMNRAWTARPTPTLDQFSTDLTDLARSEKAGFLIGHEKEFSDLLNIVSRPGKPNALLVGEPGTGKSTMIAHLAFRMIKDKVPPVLFDKRLVSLGISELVADAPPEVLAGRIQKIVEEIILAGNVVLFIPNVHDLFKTAQGKALSAMDLLLPIIQSESIPTICETYPREFKQYIEPRTDFLDQFEVIRIEEINTDEALRFLVYYSLVLEKDFKIFITFRAIKKCVELAHRYFREKPLPGSAVDLLKHALSKARESRLKELEEETVIAVAEKQSRIPIGKAGKEETEKLLNLESIIHERLINQDGAVSSVSRALREYRSGLARRGGPIATFLFVGPTGVGKTELAKILALTQFGSKDAMHRFDMSEYQDKTSIFRFIGTPSGERSGALTDAILENPYSLVLLDEFEKAHPDILNLFLQVFDDGRLTDSLGRTVGFEHTIIIATSNAHSDFIKREIEAGKAIEEISEELKKKLTDYFRPELINRFSDTIVFRSLNLDEIVLVTRMLLKDVVETLIETHGIDLIISDRAAKKIAELGYSPVFGARPLRQVISEKVRGVLALKILKKEIARGNVLELNFEKNEFQFKIIS